MTQNNEPTIAEINEAIALFDGWLFTVEGYLQTPAHLKRLPYTHYKVHQMKYHTSWDWLMPVVEKATKLVRIEDDSSVRKELNSRLVPIQNELCNTNIINVHYCVYQFIQWYNQQKQKDG